MITPPRAASAPRARVESGPPTGSGTCPVVEARTRQAAHGIGDLIAGEGAERGREDHEREIRIAGGGEDAGGDDRGLARDDREEPVDGRQREQGQVDPRRGHDVLDEWQDGIGHECSSVSTAGDASKRG